MDTDLPVPLSPAFLKVTRVRAQVCPRICAPNLPRSVSPRPPGRWATRAARAALCAVPTAGPAPAPPPPRSLRPAPGAPRSAPLAPPLRTTAPSLGGSRGSRGSSSSPSCLHGDTASQARSSEPSASGERGWTSWSALRGISMSGPAGWGSGAPRLPRHRPRSLGPDFCIPEIPRNYLDKKDAVKAPKGRQNGTLLVFDPKEKVMIDPSKPMSQKCCFGPRPRLTSKLSSSPAQISLGVANTFSTKKEASSKKIEDKVSLKSTENKPPSRSVENKDVLTNRQSDLWSSSYLKESAGEAGKESVLAKQEKVSDYCLQDVEEKLSDSTDGDGEEDTNDEDEEGPSKKETRAPLELMAEFLRAEMGRDYQLAKKLCQMILIYEPENPVAKEFFSLIEEILLKEKAQKREEDDEDSEEDTSSESDAESSEDGSEDSSDECEDGS
ncbi:glutamate-rich protein 2 isoform X1 [Peromyscus maniculatus bairdii]|uniref:glutamate-rich protein 2 isoform X1 n=1 Tax=Peromyscus maniculatus bairdii TaxID=230844 RepID=UPI003FD0600E